MAKRRRAVNKSQKIRDALAANPDKSPSEISALLKADGLNVKPQYVSTIKGNANRKAAKGRRGRRKLVRTTAARAAGTDSGVGILGSAIAFVRASGGLAEAKAALASIEEISALNG